MRPCVFVHRDGTIVADPGYLRDPDQVVLLPTAGEAIARLNASGRLVIVVSNQSGIARGRLTEAEYLAVAARLDRLLAGLGAHLDASYFCPHAPERDGVCGCRKPGLLLFERAATEHGVDLGRSWWVGDRLTDLIPAATLGGTGILVETGEGAQHRAEALAKGFDVVPDLAGAADRILSR